MNSSSASVISTLGGLSALVTLSLHAPGRIAEQYRVGLQRGILDTPTVPCSTSGFLQILGIMSCCVVKRDSRGGESL